MAMKAMSAKAAAPPKPKANRNRKPRRSGKAGGSEAMKAAMKATKKPGDKNDQKAKAMKTMKAMKATKKLMKATKKTTTAKKADAPTIGKIMRALEKLKIKDELKNVVRASLQTGKVKTMGLDGEWAKIDTHGVSEVLMNFWNEGKKIKYKWYLCFKK